MKQYRPAPPLIHVEIDHGAYQVCEVTEGGCGSHTRIGPKWPTGREAYRYADVIEERRLSPVSPLRVETPPAGADSRSPLPVETAPAEAASA